MRHNKWLKKIAQEIWHKYFADISPTNDLRVKFGKRARWQLGCIRQSLKKGSPSIVTINGYFKNEIVPQYVIESILAHEFVHYLTGFSSSRPKLFRYPHRGGIINREMRRRGLVEIEKKQKEWIDKNWNKVIKTQEH
ncbi:hypothetical protein KJ713_00375 [Patescibacteria group bacterium]|nr:hypothetical protein [Patescibacteria group bacterium]